jgi:hypothetical protein
LPTAPAWGAPSLRTSSRPRDRCCIWYLSRSALHPTQRPRPQPEEVFPGHVGGNSRLSARPGPGPCASSPRGSWQRQTHRSARVGREPIQVHHLRQEEAQRCTAPRVAAADPLSNRTGECGRRKAGPRRVSGRQREHPSPGLGVVVVMMTVSIASR